MKYLILIFSSLLFLTTNVTAQNEFAYAPMPAENISEAPAPRLSAKETQMMVASDITNKLSMDLKYPDEMISYGIEGSCMLSIKISSKGIITSLEIEDSLGLLFDREIKRVLEENNNLVLNEEDTPQKGLRIKVPIHFSF